MLLATVVLWALNLTVSRYILLHGFQPLAYATVRYGAAVAVFLAVAGTLRIARRDVWLVVVAAVLLFLNQISFVYALERTTAATVGLILGSLPIFTGLIGLVVGLGLGGALIGRTADGIVKRLEAGAMTAEELTGSARQLLLYTRIELTILVLVIVDMVAKPGA